MLAKIIKEVRDMNCNCALCKNNLPFDLPEEIIEATKSGDLVVFAGAGISTEGKLVFKETLYEDVKGDLVLNEEIDFPSLMSKYCKQINGRTQLLEKIRHRFEYCQQFAELYRVATRFHKEISSIYSIDKIITTNWDNYFELECNATPIVTAEDFAFYKIDSRKVFKIHGSISNYGSIVATTEDYKKCYKNLNSGLVGGYLKTLLATKVVVFVGYSFSDFDFNKIYSFLKKEMGLIIPHYYIITIDTNFKNKIKNGNTTVIETDASYFFSVLREHLEGTNFLIPKKNLETVQLFTYARSNAHKESEMYYSKHRTTTSIYNLFYQDGLQHAFDYLEYHSKSGQSFNEQKIMNSIHSYEHIKRQLIKVKNYQDLAYVEGYIIGMMSILPDMPLEHFPFYYIIGLGPIVSFKKFSSLLRSTPVYHITADKLGKKWFKKLLIKNSNVVPHHIPFIG